MKVTGRKALARGVILFFAWSLLAFTALCLGRVVLDARLAAFRVISHSAVTKIEMRTTYGGGGSHHSPGSEIYSAKQLWLPLAVGVTVTLIFGGLGWFLLRLAGRMKSAGCPELP